MGLSFSLRRLFFFSSFLFLLLLLVRGDLRAIYKYAPHRHSLFAPNWPRFIQLCVCFFCFFLLTSNLLSIHPSLLFPPSLPRDPPHATSITRNRHPATRLQPNPRALTTTLHTQSQSSAKLESYASPPLSPPPHWSLDLDPTCKGTAWNRVGGMDGDPWRMKQQHYDPSRFAPTAGMARRAATRPAGASERFRTAPALPAARGESVSQTPGRPRMPTYLDYGYTDAAFQDGALQGDDLQPYAPTLRDPPRPSSFAPYESDLVYNLNPSGPTQTPYEVVSSYGSARQSAAMDALSGQFAVPPYFPPNEPAAAAVPALGSSYLSSQVPLSAYNQPGPIGRSHPTQPFPATMAEMTPVGPAGRVEPASPSQPPDASAAQDAAEPANLNEVYGQFQRALRTTFEQTRAGRLIEASRSLLEISEWLVTNARELGILRDDQVLHSDRLQLWNDFNICWLALCQKQKDVTEEILQTGRQPPHTSLLSVEVMDNLGKELIQLCDRIEQHGLVDYEMGIWEEEILSVLGQCLDLMESRPDVLRSHTTSAPAVTTSRS